jgi:hypothetical protein
MDLSTAIETVNKERGIRDMLVGVIETIKTHLAYCDSYMMFAALEDENWVGENGY